MPKPSTSVFEMGTLSGLMYQYRHIVDSRELGATTRVAVDERIAADRWRAALNKLTITSIDSASLQTLHREAKSEEVSTRKRDLLQHGFAGTITGLFDRIMVVEYAVNHIGLPEDAVLKENDREEIEDQIKIYQTIPGPYRKGARVTLSGEAYYWGGLYHPIGALVSEPIIEVAPNVGTEANVQLSPAPTGRFRLVKG